MIRAGIAVILAAALVMVYAQFSVDWQPVRMPLNLAADNTATAAFTAHSNDTFELNIDLQRGLPFDELLAAQTALWKGVPTTHKGIRFPTVRCAVREGGRDVLADGYTGGYWGRSVGATVMRFAGRAGHTYSIKANVYGGDPRWQVTDPHLIVTVWRDPVFLGLNNLQAAGALAACALLLGVLLLAIGLSRARKPKQETERWTFVE
jgi:hypothetical protein